MNKKITSTDHTITLRDLFKVFHSLMSRSGVDNKISFIKHQEKKESYTYITEKKGKLDRKTVKVEESSPSVRQCFFKGREITASGPEGGFTYNYPLIQEKKVFGIFQICINQSDLYVRDFLEDFRILAKMLSFYFEKKDERRNLLRAKAELKNTASILDLVTDLSEIVVSTKSVDEISKKMYFEMKKNFGECVIGIAINSEDELKLKDCFYYELNKKLKFNDVSYLDPKDSKLLKAVLNQREYIYENMETQNQPRVIGEAPLAAFFLPLKMNDRVIGGFTYQLLERSCFTQKEISICRKLSSFLSIAINNNLQNERLLEANKRLHLDSTIDELTQVYTRRHFYDVFGKVSRKARAVDDNTFLLLTDLNRFKGVNDNFGHHAGDSALKKISYILKKVLAPGVLGRYGGDEFLGGVTGISHEDLFQTTEDIKKRVRELSIPCDEKGSIVGISIGVLEITCDKPLREYFQQLDANLYKAKQDPKGVIFSKSFP